MSECPGTAEQLKLLGASKRSTKPQRATLRTLWEECPDSGSSYRGERKSGGHSLLGNLEADASGAAPQPAPEDQPTVDERDADTNALIDALLGVRAKLEDADIAVGNALALLGVEEASDEEDAASDACEDTEDVKASRRE